VLAVHLVGESDIRFNLSHTNGVALVAVGLGRELGVDIEWHRPLEDLEAMARAVMSELELRQWLALDSEYRYVAFYHLWSRKESYLKAIGLGLYRNLHEVTVPISAERLDESGGRIHVVHDVSGEGRWQLRDVLASADYSASVCCEGVRPFAIEVEELDLGRD
jgi:4'-phosphopantetheinyl transferase